MIHNSIFTPEQDAYFMACALEEAKVAYVLNEVPIGAVVVGSNGDIIAKACNLVEARGTQTAHAEMLVVQLATRAVGDWRLDGCWIYVTLEPCTMCMGCIILSRFAGVVYGASSPLFGYHLDNQHLFNVYQKDALLIVGGIGADQSQQLLKSFFQSKRNRVSIAKDQDLHAIRQELQERKFALEEELKKLSQEKVTDAQVQDPGDQALASTMETLKSSFQDTTRGEYERIVQAIAKIDEGTYGICTDCSEPISARRLKSNPNVSRCLGCQEIYEENNM